MHAQFLKVEQLPHGLSAQERFDQVFGFLDVGPFNKSTYSDSWRTWKETAPSDLTKAVSCGHKSGGEWSPLVTAWRRASKK